MSLPKMKVAHFIAAPLYGTEGIFGGAERYALELALAMSREVNTTLITMGKSVSCEHRDGLKIVRLRNWVPWRRFVFDGVNALLPCQLQGYDVVHVHQRHCISGDACLINGLVSGQAVFATSHGGFGYGLHRFANLDDKFSGHLHVSEFSRRIARHDRYIRASTIGVGVDLQRFRPGQSPRRKEVVFVGRLLPHKGVDILLKAVGSDIPLRVIGRRAHQARRYFDYLSQLADKSNVSIEENVDDDGVIAAMQNAACVVLPSVYRSCFGEYHRVPELVGQTLLEAMACGTPVICTNVGGMPEIVAEGETGTIVEPNEPRPLREAIQNVGYSHGKFEMANRARKHVERHFSWQVVVQRCLDQYRRALN